MKKSLVLLFLLFYILSSFSQLSLYKKFDDLLVDIKKANKVIFKITYLDEPFVLTFYQNDNEKEIAKTFIFDNKICIYEHHTYPLSQFSAHKTILESIYGTPYESYSDGAILYSWKTSTGLLVSLTKKINSIPKKMGVSIVFSYEKDYEKLINATQKTQSGIAVMEFL